MDVSSGAELASSVSDLLEVEVTNLDHIENTLDHVSSALDSLVQFLNEWDIQDTINYQSNEILYSLALFGTLIVGVLLFSHVLKR